MTQRVLAALAQWPDQRVPEGSVIHDIIAAGDRRIIPRGEEVLGDSLDGASLGPALVIPLSTADRILGVLVLICVDEHVYVPDDLVDLAGSFGSQAAVTLVLAEARREHERLAVYEDRDRIARDLHDLVIQRLFATGMMLQGTTRIDDVPAAAADRVSRAVDELDETIKEIRQTIFALHEPVETDSDRLRSRVMRECAQSGALLGFSPAVRFVGAVDSSASTAHTDQLVAVVREALTNAAKHAQADRVEVLVSVEGTRLTLVVTDDGVGVSGTGRRSGLANLSARADQLGGSFVVERVSEAGGTRLTWQVPL